MPSGPHMNRRSFLHLWAALSLSRLSPALADALKALRIGYQKTGVLLVVKARTQLERRFESQSLAVRWVEFPSGPPLLEAREMVRRAV
jgi:sulfonate transport system substrate-binding protein